MTNLVSLFFVLKVQGADFLVDGGSNKLKVLVVEDDGAVRMVLTTLVREEGHEVKEASDGAEGFKLFQTFKPDLIFSDISMPNMDGLTMLEKIRRESLEVMVVMITSHGSAEFTLKALRLRANDYLIKPIMPNDFTTHLRKLADVIASRTIDQEIVGMILHRELSMKVGNFPLLAGKVADRLMRETEGMLPPPNRLGIRLGLVEIILNAIEHGNLGITYDEKTKAQESDSEDWEKLISQRQASEPFKARNVLIQFKLDADSCRWTISDEGEGFDWTKVPDPTDPKMLMNTHGRGLLLTKLSFDEVTYLGKGNQVLLRKAIAPPV